MPDDHDFHPHSGRGYVNGRVMIITFLSLFFVLLIVVLFLLYARCVLSRRARRRALIHHLNAAPAGVQTHTNEPPKTGLAPSVIATLPSFVYKKTDAGAAECAVCLSGLEDEEMARALPNCKHVFHAHCIDAWLHAHSTCPICRTGAEPREQQQEASELPVFAFPSAPPLDRSTSMGLEGTSEAPEHSSKASGSSLSRLSSFRRILNRERSESRVQSQSEDIERQ